MKRICLLILLAAALAAAQEPDKTVRARTVTPPAPANAPDPAPLPTPDNTVTGYSDSRTPTGFGGPCEGHAADRDARPILRRARTIFIRSNAPYVRAHEIEGALLKKKAFGALGIFVTRNEGEADLVLELGHKYMTTRFFFTVIEPCAQVVVASGNVSSLFGTVHDKVADSLVKQITRAREN
jgi:hypothetical protein